MNGWGWVVDWWGWVVDWWGWLVDEWCWVVDALCCVVYGCCWNSCKLFSFLFFLIAGILVTDVIRNPNPAFFGPLATFFLVLILRELLASCSGGLILVNFLKFSPNELMLQKRIYNVLLS